MGKSMKLWKNYLLGDMQAIYLTETDPDYPDRKNMELLLLPSEVVYKDEPVEKPYGDSLVQLKIAGDTNLGGYAGGRTMRQGQSVTNLQFKTQTTFYNYICNKQNYKSCINIWKRFNIK